MGITMVLKTGPGKESKRGVVPVSSVELVVELMMSYINKLKIIKLTK